MSSCKCIPECSFESCSDYKQDRILECMTNTEEKKTCKHEKTYVAVRHAGGMKLVKCSNCNCTVYCG